MSGSSLDSNSSEDQIAHQGRFHATVLVLGILAALAIRMIGFTSQSISMDEAVELGIASFPVDELITFGNSFPPLYHLILKVWKSVCTSIFTGRIFALLLGLVSIAVVYWLAFKNAGRKVAMVTVALAAISPFHTFYSQDGRAYMLYFLLAVLAFLTGTRLAREYNRLNLAAFVLVAVIGAYTHYYFAIVLIATTCGIVAQFGAKQIPRFAIAALIIGVLCLPELLLLKTDLDFQKNLRESRPLNLVSAGYTFFSFASGHSLGPSKSDLHTIQPKVAIVQAAPWIVAVAFAYGVPFIAGCFALGRKLAFWLWLLVTPLVLFYVFCLTLGLTYNPRFAVWLWVPFVVICAAGIASFKPRLAAIVGLLILAVSAMAIVNRNFVDRYKNEDVAAVAEFIRTNTGVEEEQFPLVVCAGYMQYPFQAYLDPEIVEVIPTIDASYPEGSAETAIEKCRELAPVGFWFAYSRSFHADPNGEIFASVVGAPETRPTFEAAGIRLYRIRGTNSVLPNGRSVTRSVAVRLTTVDPTQPGRPSICPAFFNASCGFWPNGLAIKPKTSSAAKTRLRCAPVRSLTTPRSTSDLSAVLAAWKEICSVSLTSLAVMIGQRRSCTSNRSAADPRRNFARDFQSSTSDTRAVFVLSDSK